MRTFFVVIVVIIVAVAGAFFVIQKFCDTSWCKFGSNSHEQGQNAVTNFDKCVKAGNPVMESYPRQCSANGQTFTENIGNANEKKDLIFITSPSDPSPITSPLVIEGQTRGPWYFEASFPVVLLDGKGNTIASGAAKAQGEWMPQDFVPFKATLSFTPPSTGEGTLVLKKDNPSGLPENEDELRVPIKFKTIASAANTTTIKVFLGNREKDPNGSKCETTYGASRTVPKTTAVARAAIEELLKGPTLDEAEHGFFTSINPGVIIQKLTVENGIATVDFDKTIEQSVAGSCKVAAIRSQITNTLKQFPSLKNVIISVDGQSGGVIQP